MRSHPLIRGRPRSSRVPILFLTAYNKEEMHVFRGYSAGAVDYVFKPIQPLVLKSKVSVFVDLHRQAEEIKRKAAAEKRLLLENLRVRGEKLEAERALRRHDAHQATVLKELPIALYTSALDGEGRSLQFTSDSIERITGFRRDAFDSPELWQSRLNPEDRDTVLRVLSSVEQMRTATLEYRWRNADGEERHILDQVVLNPGDDCAAGELLGMWFDVTERKQLEQSLQHASKLEAIGRLTGGIAHDFNNMLSIVIGNLDILKRSLDSDAKASRRIENAMAGAERCAELTTRLLTFSRRSSLKSSVLDLTTFLPRFVALLTRTLGERIEVALSVEKGVPPIRVDEPQLEAALINLAVNARDAMPSGGRLSIDVRSSKRSEATVEGSPETVEISVADTGTGIPAPVLARVFEPFFTTKEEGKGTGLGLSMVHGFVQQSGGSITIQSTMEKGTTFTISFPATAEIEKNSSIPTIVCAEDVSGEGHTALVVEDDYDVRQVAASALKSLSFSVKEARNGDDALRMLERDPSVSLIFADVNMPGDLTGIELAQTVKTRWPFIRVLLTSGHLTQEQEVVEFEFLHKPYRVNDLIAKLASAFHKAAVRSETTNDST